MQIFLVQNDKDQLEICPYTKKELEEWKNPCDLWSKIIWSDEINSFHSEAEIHPVEFHVKQVKYKSCVMINVLNENLDKSIDKCLNR